MTLALKWNCIMQICSYNLKCPIVMRWQRTCCKSFRVYSVAIYRLSTCKIAKIATEFFAPSVFSGKISALDVKLSLKLARLRKISLSKWYSRIWRYLIAVRRRRFKENCGSIRLKGSFQGNIIGQLINYKPKILHQQVSRHQLWNSLLVLVP
jgi:hypothetical protein